jgi:xylulose-5-phosphate/fructose-6-phosphate phosphoketolase
MPDHGYSWLLTPDLRRVNHHHLRVRSYKEEGTRTPPFGTLVVNDMDRLHLVMDVIDRVPGLDRKAAVLRQQMVAKCAEHRPYVPRTGEDLSEIRDWAWSYPP